VAAARLVGDTGRNPATPPRILFTLTTALLLCLLGLGVGVRPARRCGRRVRSDAIMALVATMTHVISGSFHHGVGLRRAAALSVGVVVGAQIGARMSRRVSGRRIQHLLAGGLLLLGLRLILSVAQ